ncbi:MAG: hypothetical protein V3T14_00135 [Myxococcota bacterium]
MSLAFQIGDRLDSGGGGGFLGGVGDVLGGIARGLLDRGGPSTAFPAPIAFHNGGHIPGVTAPTIIEQIFGFGGDGNGGGNGQCAPLEITRSATNPGGPPAASVWKRVEGCADTWARVPRGKRPVRDDCGNVVLKKARGRRRAAVTARDVRGARRVTKFVREFGVSSKVPAKKKGRKR